MKCKVLLRVIDGLTTNQQIYLLQHLVTQLTYTISKKPDDLLIIQEVNLRQIADKWCVEITVNPSYINTFMHIINSNRFNVLSGNIYEFIYEE